MPSRELGFRLRRENGLWDPQGAYLARLSDEEEAEFAELTRFCGAYFEREIDESEKPQAFAYMRGDRTIERYADLRRAEDRIVELRAKQDRATYASLEAYVACIDPMPPQSWWMEAMTTRSYLKPGSMFGAQALPYLRGLCSAIALRIDGVTEDGRVIPGSVLCQEVRAGVGIDGDSYTLPLGRRAGGGVSAIVGCNFLFTAENHFPLVIEGIVTDLYDGGVRPRVLVLTCPATHHELSVRPLPG